MNRTVASAPVNSPRFCGGGWPRQGGRQALGLRGWLGVACVAGAGGCWPVGQDARWPDAVLGAGGDAPPPPVRQCEAEGRPWSAVHQEVLGSPGPGWLDAEAVAVDRDAAAVPARRRLIMNEVGRSTMKAQRSLSGLRAVTVVGLVVGAVGIAILWAAGVKFPIYPPPGIIILLAGAIFVSLAPWPWAPAVGAFLGLFVTVGFLVSGGAAQPGWPGGNQCGHRHLDPDAGCAHRPGRRGAGHPGHLPEPDAGSAVRPDCGQGWSGAREPGLHREDDELRARTERRPMAPTVGGGHGEAVGC